MLRPSVSLPKSFANSKVVIEEISETEIRIRKARVIPEDDLPFEEGLRPLSDRDRDAFLALLDSPPKPTAAFRRAAAKSSAAMPEWQIEHLGDVHERAAFCCGNPALDDFIRTKAGQISNGKTSGGPMSHSGRRPKVIGVLHPGPRVGLNSPACRMGLEKTAETSRVCP